MEVDNLKTFEEQCEENTKIITSRHMFNASLQNLCMNTIIDSLRKSSKVTIDIERLADLPFLLQQELLKKLCDANKSNRPLYDRIKLEDRFRVAARLMLSQISEFNFKCLLPSFQEELPENETYYNKIPRPFEQKMIVLLAENCSNTLQKLKHTTKQCDQFEFVYPVFLGSLLQLTHLKHLELDRYVLSTSEFELLGSKLINLVYLKSHIMNATGSSVLRGLRPMKKLIVFIFFRMITMPFWNASCKDQIVIDRKGSWLLYNLVMKENPQLRIVGELLNRKMEDDSPYHSCHSFGIEDQTLYGAMGRSELQHLRAVRPITKNQARWHSNVDTIRINLRKTSIQDLSGLLQLRNVTSLTLGEQVRGEWGAPMVRRFLKVYGPNLTSFCLTLKNVLSIEEVLSFCPKLKTLGMEFARQSCTVPYFDGVGTPDLQQFEALTEIYLKDFDFGMAPKFLVQLFTSKNLNKLTLIFSMFDASSTARALSDLQMQDVIAPKLNTLKVIYSFIERGYFNPEVPHGVKYQHLFQLLKYVCSKAPVLKNTHFYNHDWSFKATEFSIPVNQRAKFV